VLLRDIVAITTVNNMAVWIFKSLQKA